MKKLIILFSALAIVLSFSACRKETKTSVTNTTHSNATSSPDSNTLIEERPPERVDGRILIKHNEEKAWLSNADSEYIKSVISKFEVTECALFYGNKEYILHISGTSFGGDVVYYDSSNGVIGNSSSGHISNEEQVKFNNMLSGYFS